MNEPFREQQQTDLVSFLEAGCTGWACLLAICGGVLLALGLLFSLLTMSLETFTLGMAAAAFAFAGQCWLLGRMVRLVAAPRGPQPGARG